VVGRGFYRRELDWLQQKAKEATQEAQVGGRGSGGVNQEVRRSELNWLTNTEETRGFLKNLLMWFQV
jgi:hypothetical protein